MLIEPITRANSREMVQRYQETYGFLTTGSGKKILVYINEIGESFTRCMDGKGNKYTLNSDTGLFLEFTQVPSQWFMPDGKHIMYVTRRAERQWKRGICRGNTNVFIPDKSGRLTGYNLTTDLVELMFSPDENTKAFKDWPDIDCGVWSKHFAWAAANVYVRDILIGTVDHKEKTVKLEDSELFAQEMRDALIRSNSDYRVVQ